MHVAHFEHFGIVKKFESFEKTYWFIDFFENSFVIFMIFFKK